MVVIRELVTTNTGDGAMTGRTLARQANGILLPRYGIALAVACAVVLTFAANSTAQRPLAPPNLLALQPSGAQVGTTAEVKFVTTTQLEGAKGLVFSHAGITAKPTMREADPFYPEPRPIPGSFQVTVAKDVPPGIYEVRATGKFGVSNARKFVVGSLPEVLEKEDNNKPEVAQEVELGTTVNGLLEASNYDHYRFTAKAGQPIVIDCQAQRIDALGDATMTLLSPAGKELVRSQNAAGHDPVIALVAPGDGEYVLRIYELTYGSNPSTANSPYRLTVRTGAWIDFIDPPVAQPGAASRHTLYGRNLGGSVSEMKVDGQPLEQLDVQITAPAQGDAPDALLIRPVRGAVDFFTYRHAVNGGTANPIPIALAEGAVSREQEPADATDAPTSIQTPIELVGRFDRAGDRDVFEFTAKKGDELWIEVFSERLGMPTDPLLVVQRVTRDDEGEIKLSDVTSQDDLASPMSGLLVRLSTTDPAYLFNAGEDGTYRIMIKNQFTSGKQGPASFYLLRVRPPKPDFRLFAMPGTQLPSRTTRQSVTPRSCQVQTGGGGEILVVALRREGFDGEIEINLTSPPAGVQASRAILGPGSSATSLVLLAPHDAQGASAMSAIVGKAAIDGGQRERTAHRVETLWMLNNNSVPAPARIASQVAVAVDRALTIPCRLEPAEKKVWRMARGGKLSIPLKLVKSDSEFKGTVNNVSPVGLPSIIRANPITIQAGKPEGKLEFDVDQRVVPGRMSVFFRGEVDLDYRHNLEAVELATKDKERIEKKSKELAEVYKQATAARQQSDRDVQTAQQAQNNANSAKQRAEQAASQATQTAKAAADQAATTQKQAQEAASRAAEAAAKVAQAGEDDAKKAAQAAADEAKRSADQAKAKADADAKAAQDQAVKAKAAADELTKAQKALADARSKLEEANKQKEQTAEAEQNAKTDTDKATAAVREITTLLQNANNVARARKVRVPVYSEPFTLEIVAMPAAVKLAPSDLTVTAGEQAELNVTAKREFDFADEITFQLQAPSGVGGLGLSGKIEKGKDQGKLTFTTAKTTKPGSYEAEVIIRVRFNNRQLEERQKIGITIKPAPAEKKR